MSTTDAKPRFRAARTVADRVPPKRQNSSAFLAYLKLKDAFERQEQERFKRAPSGSLPARPKTDTQLDIRIPPHVRKTE